MEEGRPNPRWHIVSIIPSARGWYAVFRRFSGNQTREEAKPVAAWALVALENSPGCERIVALVEGSGQGELQPVTGSLDPAWTHGAFGRLVYERLVYEEPSAPTYVARPR